MTTLLGAYVTLETGVNAIKPAHETIWFGSNPDVYIHVQHGHQVTHDHYFDVIGRDGGGTCTGCGATAWSTAWVRVGFMGDETHAWLVAQDRANRDMVDESAYLAVDAILQSRSLVIADLNPDAPARVYTQKEN